MFTFTFDHGVSDGECGYGAVRVEHRGGVSYVGRGFARTVLVERFPDAGLTYDQASRLVTWLSVAPTGARSYVACPVGNGATAHWAAGGDCGAHSVGLWCECQPDDIGCNYEAASRQATQEGWGY